jgi:hypothetical protein
LSPALLLSAFSVAELAKLLQLSYQGEGTRVLTRVSIGKKPMPVFDFPGWEESRGHSTLPAGCVIAQPNIVSSG